MAQDAAGNIYFSDQGSHMVRRIAPDGTITAVAGNGESGFSGDGEPATAARLAWPAGLTFDGADTASHRIRKVAAGGAIQTIAGSDSYGSAGDGGPASLAQLINPRSLAFDPAGNLLLTDSSAHVVRRITPAGIIQRVAGTGQDGTSGNGGPAVAAQLDLPWGIAVDSSGDILIGDGYAIRSVNAAGTIQNVSYTGVAIRGLVMDGGANVWIAGGAALGVLSRGGPPFPLGPIVTNQAVSNTAAAGFPLYPNFPSAAVAPGEFVSIPGLRLGPAKSVVANPVATEIAGVRVLFDGFPAPIFSVQSDQVNAIVPYEISGKSTVGIVVEVNGVASNVSTVAVLPAVPQLYLHGFGTLVAATALNQDGSANGPGNPDSVGTVIALFAAGAGNMTPPASDGALVSTQSLPAPCFPCRSPSAAVLFRCSTPAARPASFRALCR